MRSKEILTIDKQFMKASLEKVPKKRGTRNVVLNLHKHPRQIATVSRFRIIQMTS